MLVGWLVGFCLVILLPKITDRSVKSLGFVRDETEVRKFNHCEEEQDVISFGMVIAQLLAQLLDTQVNKVKCYAEQAAV